METLNKRGNAQLPPNQFASRQEDNKKMSLVEFNKLAALSIILLLAIVYLIFSLLSRPDETRPADRNVASFSTTPTPPQPQA